jgi:endonuclease YncB( thermonuclease family)
MVLGAARALFVFAGISCLAAGFGGAARACALSDTETGTVAAVIDGETLKLADGRIVRLTGAKAPMPPLGWRGDDPWPLVEEAKEALTALASGKTVELAFGGRRSDRHGYALAQAFVVEAGNRLWLQKELVARGLARVYALEDNRACIGELLAAENEARAKGVGVWGTSAYRIVDALDLKRLGRLIHSYQLVEGKVAAVGEGGGRVYLNFAEDWRSDFTISIERKQLASFAAAGLAPKSLAGRHIRVRGFLAWRNGPMIEATHPEQIELLPEASEHDRKTPQLPPSIAL